MSYLLAVGAWWSRASKSQVSWSMKNKSELRSKLSAFRCVLRPRIQIIFLWEGKKRLREAIGKFLSRKKWKKAEEKPYFINPYQIVWQLTVTIFLHSFFLSGSVISEWILTILKNLQAGWKTSETCCLHSLLHLLHGWRRTSPWFLDSFIRFSPPHSLKSKGKPYINLADHIDLESDHCPEKKTQQQQQQIKLAFERGTKHKTLEADYFDVSIQEREKNRK